MANIENMINHYKISGSIKDTARVFDISEQKIRRILISIGALTTDKSEKIRELASQGLSANEIAIALNMREKTVQGYMPYTKSAYKSESPTKNAAAIRRHRAKRKPSPPPAPAAAHPLKQTAGSSKEKKCAFCGDTFLSVHNAKYCKKCKPETMKIASRQWQDRNPDYISSTSQEAKNIAFRAAYARNKDKWQQREKDRYAENIKKPEMIAQSAGLTAYMEKNGISVSEFAAILQVHPVTIYSWRAGKRAADYDQLLLAFPGIEEYLPSRDLLERKYETERPCVKCGTVFLGRTSAKFCESCRSSEKDKREMMGLTTESHHFGEVDYCVTCGAEYIRTAGRQKYCKNCSTHPNPIPENERKRPGKKNKNTPPGD